MNYVGNVKVQGFERKVKVKKMNKYVKNKDIVYYGLYTVVVSLGLYIVIYAICGFYPFGEFTTLTWDLEGQYVSFLSYFRQILLENDITLYSQVISLGSGTIGLIAYYLLSPFNVLLMLFELHNLPIGITIIILCKHCTSALVMFYFLYVKFSCFEYDYRKNKYKVYSVLAVIYSLCGFAVNMQFNIMWLDGLIFLPLICAGLEKAERTDRKGLAVFSLWMALITNFYIGYMLWIFSFLYFVFLRLEYGKKENRIRKWFNYISIVLTALGLGMVLLLPLLYSLSLRNSGESKISKLIKLLNYGILIKLIFVFILLVIIGFYIYKNKKLRCNCKKVFLKISDVINKYRRQNRVISLFIEIVVILIMAAFVLKIVNILEYKGKVTKEILYLPLKIFIGTFDVDEIRDGLPNVYVCSLVVILVIQFFLNAEIKMKEKLIYGSLPMFMLVSMFVKRIDYVWHGFAYPHGSNYRYSFLFSFCMILIAAKNIDYLWKDNKGDLKEEQIELNVIGGLIVSLAVIFSLYKYPSLGKEFLSNFKIVITVFFYIVTFGCLKRRRTNKLIVMVLIVAIELCCNGVLCLRKLPYQTLEDYQKEVRNITEVLDVIEENEEGNYRIEIVSGRSNDALLYGYDSITHYSSMMPEQSALLLGEFDLTTENMDNMQVKYQAGMDAKKAGLLNIKYVISKEKLNQEGMVEICAQAGYRIYENLAWKQRGLLIAKEDITEEPKDFVKLNSELVKDVAQIDGIQDDKLKFYITNEADIEKYLVLSVADEKGWSAMVDGKSVDIEKAYGALISVSIPKGSHEVIFEYQVPYLRLGIFFSSLVLAGVFVVYIKKGNMGKIDFV